MKKVYIASPYTKGDVAINVKRQLDAADQLMDSGFAPYVPLLSHFQHIAHPRDYHDWVKLDMEWMSVCDCVLRLDVDSVGADAEVKEAKRLGIPVYFSIADIE